ncbi:HAD family hydrolase [Jannaschia rubra]|uniref:Phosphoglycolate phosphatase n=1 Tax=Jannaschia rubra TaxID=282197 RepID=A0A0M6XVY9_9RHOB|nr:HAD family phosphatase [Jannaschia rubra]CTQ34727.1 Phosphoglycolate phosphatase [Jannaschia rubra]SFG69319.1 haloacid dehalogenase superfamily, subfamily IA, variant 3 with third motif having DD or ED/haloacid dehalogenase superfamily, subfamily IA, variant 1 with third motif having Dx(3-4)D or Dx(3-4)E [Jannaschia rubra]
MTGAAIRAVIFDLDGCLVDSEPLVLGAIAAEMRALGIADATAEEIRASFLGRSMDRIRAHVAARLGRPCPAEFGQRVEERLARSYPTDLRLSDGAPALLDRLDALGMRYGIATGGSVRRLEMTLEAVDLTARFAGTGVSADEVAEGKPAPDVFLRAAERLGVAPRQCLVIEDSPHGIEGARRAGMPALGYVGGSHLQGIRDDHAEVLRRAGAAEVHRGLDTIGVWIDAQHMQGASR